MVETTPNKNDPIAQRLSVLSLQSTKTEKRWNVFRSVPRDQYSYDSRWTLFAAQCLKIIFYVILIVAVCGSGLSAKMAFLLIVAGINGDRSYVPCEPTGYKGSMVPQDQRQLPADTVGWFYWGLWVAYCIPQLLLFIRSIRIVWFKLIPSPSITLFFTAFFIESLQTIGVCLLVFCVLPQLDSVRASMLLCGLAVTPAFFRSLERVSLAYKYGFTMRKMFFIMIDSSAFVCQASALWIWPALDPTSEGIRWILPLAVLLTSTTYWENYVDRECDTWLLDYLAKLRDRLQRVRYKSQLLLTIWKIFLSLFMMIICGGARHSVHELFNVAYPLEKWHNQTKHTELPDEERLRSEHANEIWLLGLVLCLSTFVCYQCARFACKVKMDRVSYAVPTVIVLPVTTMMLLSFCETRRTYWCYFSGWIPDRLFWECDYGPFLDGFLGERLAWAWLLWLGSYLWLIRHMFSEKTGRLNQTDTIFMNSLYEGLFVDQYLALNRRRHRLLRIHRRDLDDNAQEESTATDGTDASLAVSMTSLSLLNSRVDAVTKIYICATMWHENRNEMVQTLKSILRMDEDQSARRNAQKYLKVIDKDYYELEAHIFFDDAWTDDERGFRRPNEFVETFVSAIDEAASSVHNIQMKLKLPVKFDLPYGGRLVWTMPGDNRLFVHLKDKQKIRNKKRWSQVMYMYYLLGHRVMELISDVGRKQTLADNTFLLTIDGDSKFTPSSVQKLVDLMRKYSRLGSACGRIHPIGTGIMVWYQKFEYAIAHWFQKAAEHVFGCVLCSPGCFSLFRGSAFMDDNVINKYTKLPTEAHHFVQYDQGEDRWLSTLLLKQGYRIEYAAAADADTHAPEGFDEFFNQRRRWTPSSIANTLDLLADYKKAVKNNDSLSVFYIFYQMLVILFSLLSPAIIFTMMLFAQVAAFGIESGPILWANIVPVAAFIVACFASTTKVQLLLAKLLSIVYAFIMMAVLVATGVQITTEGAGSPISVFVMSLAGIFFVAAFFHPHECYNILYGTVFFLMIPCTYVILSLYALINLNVINWGTREAAEKAVGGKSETKLQEWMRKLREQFKKNDGDQNGDGSYGDLCRSLTCCGGSRNDRRDEHLVWVGDHLTRMDRRLEQMDNRLEEMCKRRLKTNILSSPPNSESTTTPSPPTLALVCETKIKPDGKLRMPKPSEVPLSATSGTTTFFTPPERVDAQDAQDAQEISIDLESEKDVNDLPAIFVTSPTPARGGESRRRLLKLEQARFTPSQGRRRARSENYFPTEMVPFSASKYRNRFSRSTENFRMSADDLHLSRSSSMPFYDAYMTGDLNNNDIEEMEEDLRELAGLKWRKSQDRISVNKDENPVPPWMELDYLRDGRNDILDEIEHQFWTDLIEEYLKPIQKTPEEEAKIADGLRDLRNKIAFGLLLINALLVLIIYLLQLNKDVLSISWNPTGNYTVKKYDPVLRKRRDYQEALQIEPIGFTIILFLSLILIIQTIGMICHRWQTLQHTLASTLLPCFKRTELRERNGEKLLEENAFEIAMRLQKLDDEDGRSRRHRSKGGTAAPRNRRVVFNLEQAQRQKKQSRGLHATFQKRFFNFNPDKHRDDLRDIRLDRHDVMFHPDSAKKAAARALKKRRDSLIEDNTRLAGSFTEIDESADVRDATSRPYWRERPAFPAEIVGPTRLSFENVSEVSAQPNDAYPVVHEPSSAGKLPKSVSFSDVRDSPV